MPWSSKFEEPIVLPGGRKLATLQQAADYVIKLPKAEQELEVWQIAVRHLMLAAETGGGWLMFADMAMRRALHRDVERVFDTSRKETHWGKRKLKRDE